MIEKISFANDSEREKHYQKHVIEKKEPFPHVIRTTLDYENGANQDISNFSFYSISRESINSYRLAYFRLVKPSSTLAITSSGNNPKLITYFVPVSTFLPEFIYFTYSTFSIRRIFINHDPLQLLLIDKKYSLDLISNWTTALEEEFLFEKIIDSKNNELSKFLFFLKKRDKNTVVSEYNQFQRNLSAYIKSKLLNPSESIKFNMSDFIIELKEKILYCNHQLENLSEESILSSGSFLIFTMAYFYWVYTELLLQKAISLSSSRFQQLGDIFQAYQQVFSSLIKKNLF